MGVLLTEKQMKVLNLIIDYIKENNYSPTVRELADLNGNKSSATMQEYLKKLEKQGYISNKSSSPRTIKVLKTI
jgi:repressor LexA